MLAYQFLSRLLSKLAGIEGDFDHKLAIVEARVCELTVAVKHSQSKGECPEPPKDSQAQVPDCRGQDHYPRPPRDGETHSCPLPTNAVVPPATSGQTAQSAKQCVANLQKQLRRMQ